MILGWMFVAVLVAVVAVMTGVGLAEYWDIWRVARRLPARRDGIVVVALAIGIGIAVGAASETLHLAHLQLVALGLEVFAPLIGFVAFRLARRVSKSADGALESFRVESVRLAALHGFSFRHPMNLEGGPQ